MIGDRLRLLKRTDLWSVSEFYRIKKWREMEKLLEENLQLVRETDELEILDISALGHTNNIR